MDRAKELYPEINVEYGSAFDIPFSSKSFDSVFCKAVLEHQHPEEYPQIVYEMCRVAKTQLLLVFFLSPTKKRKINNPGSYWHNIYSKDEIIDVCLSLYRCQSLQVIEGLGVDKDHAVYLVKLDG